MSKEVRDKFPEVFAAVEDSLKRDNGLGLIGVLTSNPTAEACIALGMTEEQAVELATYKVQAIYAHAREDDVSYLNNEEDFYDLLADETDIDSKFCAMRMHEIQQLRLGKSPGARTEEYKDLILVGDSAEFLLSMLADIGALVCVDCPDTSVPEHRDNDKFGAN